MPLLIVIEYLVCLTYVLKLLIGGFSVCFGDFIWVVQEGKLERLVYCSMWIGHEHNFSISFPNLIFTGSWIDPKYR
jgi:hypothetical protein